MKRVVVGLDGSPPSFAALRWAAMLASRADLDLVAAWAWLPGTVRRRCPSWSSPPNMRPTW